jgi:hypothetical protein
MGHPDRQHLPFDEKVKILEEKVVVTRSVFVTVNNDLVRKMIDVVRFNYEEGSEAKKAVLSLIQRLENSGRLSAPLALGYRMLLDMK